MSFFRIIYNYKNEEKDFKWLIQKYLHFYEYFNKSDYINIEIINTKIKTEIFDHCSINELKKKNFSNYRILFKQHYNEIIIILS